MPHITLGHNIYRGTSTPIQFSDPDRLRHMYMIGKTGVGKSTVFANMCLQDIENLHGVCFIDPHGEAIRWLLDRIPEGRLEDVILFDPSDTSFPPGLNLLEGRDKHEQDFLVNELIEIFYKLFDPEKTGVIGPQFEHWLRNAALTVMAGPEGGTLLEIPKLFIDKRFELHKRQYVTDPVVREFWSMQMAKTADFHRSEMLNYFSSKFGRFLGNTVMRNILGQTTSSFNFEEAIAGEKIILIDLSKGKLGELNSHMLGLIILAKLQAAVLKRASLDPSRRPSCYLYVDEFQNITTDTFSSMLSESRKYGLAVHVTNQFFGQLPPSLQKSVLGNAGTMLAFSLGIEDAELLEKEFQPFSKQDLSGQGKFNFYIKLMANGQTTHAFSGVSLPPLESSDRSYAGHIRTLCRLRYTKPQALVEYELLHRLGMGLVQN